MNDFEYIIAIKELDSFKTLKAYEGYIRKYVKTLMDMGVGSYYKHNSFDISSASNLYRCVTKARNNYKNYNKLPTFILDYVKRTHQILFDKHLEAATPLSMFWKTFENDKCIILPTMSIDNLGLLSDYIQDTAMPVPFRYSLYVSPIGKGIQEITTETGLDSNIASVEILKAARNKPYRETVLEDCLSQKYSSIGTPISCESVDNAIDILTRALTNIKERQ